MGVSLVDFVQRVAGAVGGAAAALLKTRKTIYFDPEHFDVEDDATTRVNGTAADPGVETGFTKIRITEGAFPAGGVSTSRQIIAGAGLTGGGTLAADRTLNVVSDTGSLDVGANSVDIAFTGSDPQSLAAAADPGVEDRAARADHVHPHDGTENATASTLVLRGSDGVLRQIKTSVGTSVVVGAELLNTTDASGGGNQYSPALVLTGEGWTGAASHVGNWAIQGRPLGTTSELHFLSQINGGGYTSRMNLSTVQLTVGVDFFHSNSGGKVGFYGTSAISRPGAYTQTYSTADKTLSAWTPDTESVAYTGIATDQGGTPYATVDDLNQLRVAYENLRTHNEDLTQLVNAILDDLQALGLLQ